MGFDFLEGESSALVASFKESVADGFKSIPVGVVLEFVWVLEIFL